MKIASCAFVLLIASMPLSFAAGVRSAIDAANQAFGAAYAAGNADAIAKLYTDGATVFPPGSDMVSGRSGIRDVWAGAIKSGLKFTSLKTVSVEQYGDAAREIGRFTADAPDGHKLNGKYVVVWKRVKGAWKLDTDIWNLNQ